jgi:hypothetical protein
MTRARALGAAALLLSTALTRTAHAHELQPAMLSLTETGPGDYDVDLRLPVETAVGQSPAPIFPPDAEPAGGGRRTRVRVGDLIVERFQVRIPGGLAGRHLGMRFARGAGSEVLVRITNRDGRSLTGRLLPRDGGRQADWEVPTAPSARAVVASYLPLGVEHILTGFDHLAFVLGLVLLTPLWRNLWKTVTAFTAAHSFTLALAAVGLVRVPPAPVEATIALSILFVAREAWRAARAGPGSAERQPWTFALGFGLLHGLGFAGALSQVGLPESDVPLALASFNVGVEVGQLAFVLVALSVRRALASIPWRARARLLPAYAIGSLAAFWVIERISRFWS